MNLLLAYTPTDGREPAARLAALLRTLGFAVDDVAAGAPASPGPAVIVLLTPAALHDHALLGQLAPKPGRSLLPLSAADPASFPTPADLARVLEWRSAAGPGSTLGAKYHVVAPVNSVIGEGNVIVNAYGAGAGWSAAEVAQLVTALRSQTSGEVMSAQELRGLLAGLQTQIQQVNADLRQGFVVLLARYDAGEQRMLSVLLARLDAQELALTNAILDALDAGALPAAELEQHLTAMLAVLQEIRQAAGRIEDKQLATGAAEVAEAIAAPGLDIKHKLKIGFPIIPLVLAYEGEVELSGRMNLEATWETLKGWVRQRQG